MSCRGKLAAIFALAVTFTAGAASAAPVGFEVRDVGVALESSTLDLRLETGVTLLVPHAPTSIENALDATTPGLATGTPDAHAEATTHPAENWVPVLPDGLLLIRATSNGGRLDFRVPGAYEATFPVAPTTPGHTALHNGANSHLLDATTPAGLPTSGTDTPGDPMLTRALPDEPTATEAPTRTHDGGELQATANTARIPAGDRGTLARTAAGAALGAGTLSALGWAMYHRAHGHATLRNKTRSRVYETICNRPGIGVQEIADTTGISYSTATYHIDRLVANRMIIPAEDGNKLRYYKNGGAFTPEERKVLPILKNAEAARLLEAILQNPGTYRAALADELGVTATTINWHLKRLRSADLIVERREGRSAYLHVDGQRFLDTFTPLAEKLEHGDAANRLHRLLELAPTSRAPNRAEAASA